MTQQASVPEGALAVAERMKAGEQLGAMVGLNENQIKSMAALGYNLYQQGKLKEAGIMFKGVAASDTNAYYGFAGVGAVALAMKPADLQTAFTYLTRAVELKPDDADIQANLGETLLRMGKLDEAKVHLEKAFQLDPGHKDPGVNRARAIVTGLDAIVKEATKRKEAAVSKAS
jgi:tetratricopeptide (TPR) repeat protein